MGRKVINDNSRLYKEINIDSGLSTMRRKAIGFCVSSKIALSNPPLLAANAVTQQNGSNANSEVSEFKSYDVKKQ